MGFSNIFDKRVFEYGHGVYYIPMSHAGISIIYVACTSMLQFTLPTPPCWVKRNNGQHETLLQAPVGEKREGYRIFSVSEVPSQLAFRASSQNRIENK